MLVLVLCCAVLRCQTCSISLLFVVVSVFGILLLWLPSRRSCAVAEPVVVPVLHSVRAQLSGEACFV